MKIVVATAKGGLKDFVNQAFGRAPMFTIVDIEEEQIKNIKVAPNPGASASRGAGVQAAQFCINENANVVIAGQFGPNSSQILQASSIKFVSAPPTMTVEEAVRAFLRGELTQAILGPEGGMGPGKGSSRRMGRRRGQGMGHRRGQDKGAW
ncbi:NifB/NifX family molybdenum-iron cluster-binding protein [Thermococcus argininiproducens]|uniref:NifB/NifX family molybdenum-iron cluster-binding protein n=1 Tax=Thermococcus argininiproducens TaxID=2866384 RepID=A0A9E7SCI8_9EURY|nr:NifB/NifX family molybdenum-iron cluster-binding protein [Thermococcus argininiproducens]USG99217.1 NifB/NifX family molybdenum-iron cluster-binding protein [Thermococcus argininiproducens]